MSTSIKHRISITALAAFMGLACSAITLPVLAIADGQHNDKTCYAETAGGIEMSSPCSSRDTVCNDDFTCSIGGVVGEMQEGLEMNKADIIADISDEPTDTSTNTGGNKATDYNSSRSNKADTVAAPDDDDDSDSNDSDATANHNSTRSNKTKPIASPDADDDNDGNKATDYNSSRSNKADTVAAPDGDASAVSNDVYIKILTIDGESAESKDTTAGTLGKAHSDSAITPGNGPELVELGQPNYDKTKNAKPAKAKSTIKIGDIKGNARRRGDTVLEDVTVVKELDKSSTNEACNAVDDDCDDDGVE